MTNIFPGGFSTATELDNDDKFLVGVDGLVQEAPTPLVRGFMAPSGFYDVSDYTPIGEQLLQDAETTTGWTLAFPSSGETIKTSTSHTQGTNSVSGSLNFTTGVQSKLYYTWATPLDFGTRSLIAFDVSYDIPGPNLDVKTELECKVSDGAVFTGNVNVVPFPQSPEFVWNTVVLPLAGLTSLKSIGVHRTGTLVYASPTNWRATIRIDNVRFIDESQIDVALGSTDAAVAWVPPSYSLAPTQFPITIPEGKGILDPARGVYSKQNKIIWLHDSFAHIPGAETGEVDVGVAINGIINAAPPGSIIRGVAGAVYRFDGDLTISRGEDLTIDFTGAMCVLTYSSNSAFIKLSGCKNVTFIGGLWLGYYRATANGSSMLTVAGAPTTVGTTKVLDALNEEVSLTEHTNWLAASHFSRHMPQQLGLPADGGQPRCYWEFVLSDTGAIINDCVLSVYDDTVGTLLTSSTVTLTPTPTTYRLEYVPTDLRMRLKVTVKKATATVNPITITSATPYGENEYDADYDVASCFVVANSRYTTFKDMWIEGFGGDGIQLSDANVKYLHVDGVTSRACRRQGMSFNQGTDMLIENVVCAEVGRSGIDFEPYDDSWFTQRVVCRNITFYNMVNYGLAMGNWARNFDFLIDGVDLYTSRIGFIYGGARNAIFRNFRCWSSQNNAFTFMGQDLLVENVYAMSGGSIECNGGTNTFDPGTGAVVYTAENNVLRNAFSSGNSGQEAISTNSVSWRFEGSTAMETVPDLSNSSTVPIGPFNIGNQKFSNLNLGFWQVQFPNTYKGTAFSSIWMPGGFNHLDDPVFSVRSLSGGTTKGNNLRGVNVVLPAGATSFTVTFPTVAAIGTFQTTPTATSGVSAGSLTPSTTYYYRIGAKTRFAGPATWQSATGTTSPTGTAMALSIRSQVDHANERWIDSFTVLRGTVNGGPYTHRYDVTPIIAFPALRPSLSGWGDLGTQLNQPTDGWGYATSYPVQVGSWMAVNETGYEPDTNYGVQITTNWQTQPWVTNKTQAGFTVNFPTGAQAAPLDGTGRFDWFLVR
jgi:hypothetical protein